MGVACCVTPLSTVSCPHLCSHVSSPPLSGSLCSSDSQDSQTGGQTDPFLLLLFCFCLSQGGKGQGGERETEKRTKVKSVWWRADGESMPCVCVAGPQEEATLGSVGWTSPEELSEQASQAQQLERLAQLCIMSKQ